MHVDLLQSSSIPRGTGPGKHHAPSYRPSLFKTKFHDKEWISLFFMSIQILRAPFSHQRSNNVHSDEISNSVPVASLSSSLFINLVVCAITMFAFWATSSSAPWCYKPRQCRPTANGRRDPPPAISLFNLTWIKAMFSLKEADLAKICGLDALMFIRFHLLGLKFFVPLAIVRWDAV